MTSILLAISLLLPQAMETQTDWVSGPGTLGPVTAWGSAFYQSESINFNISGQISLVATTDTGMGGWLKHVIQTGYGIDGHDAIFPADFDGDGDLDLAGAVWSPDRIRIFKNQVVETETVNYVLQTELSGTMNIGSECLIWCGDFDGDNDNDIVVPSLNNLVWFENNGGFSFTYHLIGTRSYYYPCCWVGDVDNDNDNDIVVGQQPLDLWRNNGSMSFTRENISSGSGGWRVMLGYLNNDNYLDLLAGDEVYINAAGDSFPSTFNWTANLAGMDGIWIRDFNNDGKQDLLISDQWGTQAIYWYENDGTGINYTQHIVCPSPTGYYYGDGCVSEDIDLDGKADVAGTYSRVGFFKQVTPDSFQEIIVDNDFDESHWVFVANLDYKPGGSDFDIDILGTGYREFAWWENVTAGAQFAAYGYLESSILEKTDALSWLKLHWSGARPTGTICKLWVRSGADTSSIQTNTWQGPFDVPTGQPNGEFDITGVTTPGHHYFQYKVEMGCGTVNESPVLYDVAVEYVAQAGAGHDVGVVQIIIPLDTIVAGTTVIPTAEVKNFGGYDECFWVFFTIGCIYYDFRVVRLDAGASTIVEFNPWVAVAGYYNEAAATYLDVDENPDNDMVDEWLMVTPSIADAARGNTMPIRFQLFEPYPNPTPNNLMINYALPKAGPVELMIYDVNGRVVRELISETKAPGYYRINTDCRELGSGVYIVKMQADKFEARMKFVVTN